MVLVAVRTAVIEPAQRFCSVGGRRRALGGAEVLRKASRPTGRRDPLVGTTLAAFCVLHCRIQLFEVKTARAGRRPSATPSAELPAGRAGGVAGVCAAGSHQPVHYSSD
jgi:hypothetical protein